MDITVVVLTGGKSSRFGSDKSTALLGEKTLVAHVIESIPVDWPIVVVGPKFTDSGPALLFTREEPIGGGPVCALAAGLTLVTTEFAAVIATDMPFAGKVIRALANQSIKADGLVPVDEEGFRQTLCAIYRVAPLKTAFISLRNLDGKSMKTLTALLNLDEITLGKEFASNLLDIDTPDDLQRAKSEGK